MKRGLVLLAMLLLAPTSLAQLPGTTIGTDPLGDPALGVAETVDVPLNQRWKAIDFVEVSMDETEQDFHLWIQVADMADSAPPELIVVDNMGLEVAFQFGGMEYTVRVARSGFYPVDSAPSHSASLYQEGPSDSFRRRISELDLELLRDDNTFHVTIDRNLILDVEGAPPLPGKTLINWRGESEAIWAQLAGLYVNLVTEFRYRDFLPDEGNLDFEWEVQYGIEANGDVSLYSERPFRVSNGEATTFLYEAEITNTADHADTIELSAANLPAQWVVTFPQEAVRVMAEDSLTVPVLVTVPFAHAHGERASFNLTAQSRSDPLSYANVDLGVLYTPVPQPAGHHNTLYMHIADGNAYVNTLNDDPASTGGEDMASSSSGLPLGTSYFWTVPLSPGLQMGLDMDMDSLGELELPIGTIGPLNGAVLSGQFILQGPDDVNQFGFSEGGDVIATFESEPFNAPANGQGTAIADIIPLPVADYWPYQNGHNILLQLELETGATDPSVIVVGAPSLRPGGFIQLPLEEFHDDVRAYFSSLSGVELYSVNGQQRLVNPGDTVVFTLTAENIGAEAAQFDLELTGTQLDWVKALGSQTIRLGPGEQRQLAVTVQPGMEAMDGDLIDVTLHATKSDDANVRSLIRLLAEVDTETDHPDETSEANSVDAALTDKPTPAPLLLPLLGLALLRRRLA